MDAATLKQLTERLWVYARKGDESAIRALMAAARLEESQRLTEIFKRTLQLASWHTPTSRTL
jgi:hypothetical protein